MSLSTIVTRAKALFTKYAREAVAAGTTVLVVLGALPAIAQSLGVAHIVVPASLLGYATVASSVIAGLIALAKRHGITPASVAAAVAHRAR